MTRSHIAVLTRQLSLLARVINANQNGSSPPRRTGRHNVHGLVDINHARRRQLGHLIEPHALELAAHLAQNTDPAHGAGLGVAVAVQDFEQGRGASASGAA